jgi:protein involved in polysaccharide export with SLBB domain
MRANFHIICRMRRAFLAASASLVAATLFAAPPAPVSNSISNSISSPISNPVSNSSGAPAATTNPSEGTAAEPAKADYRIGPNDQIKFRITGETEDPLIQRVTSQGEISIPLLGAVKVAGLTLRESEALMEKLYHDEGYFISPQVILSVDTYAPRTVSVLGQVNNPNQIDFPIERNELGIVTAITRAGGFTRVAQINAVKVMRTVDGKEVSFTVDVAAYLDKTTSEEQFKLLPDDIVFVPERVF